MTHLLKQGIPAHVAERLERERKRDWDEFIVACESRRPRGAARRVTTCGNGRGEVHAPIGATLTKTVADTERAIKELVTTRHDWIEVDGRAQIKRDAIIAVEAVAP